jgi:hypothetical protein
MAIFRQYIAPLLAVLVFLVALAAVSARIFLPSDMAAPAPLEDGGIGRGGDRGQEYAEMFSLPMSASLPSLGARV